MSLTGDPKITFSYPRIIFSSGYGVGGYGAGGYGLQTLDFDDPAEAVSPPLLDAVRAESYSPSGKRKVLDERSEERRTITWQHLDANKIFDLAEFFRTHGGKGKQFELYLDRFTGAFLEFNGVLSDQQGTLGTLTGQGSFEASTFGQGLRLGAGGFFDFATAPASQQPSLAASEGILILVVKPSFAGNDSVNHILIDIDPAGNGRLRLSKTSTNNLQLQIEDVAAGIRQVDIAVSWAANSEQKIVGKWKDSSSLELWLNGVKGPAATGSGTGVLPSLPTNLRMGAVAAGSSEANGLYDRLGFFTRAFSLNTVLVNLLTDGFFPRWKNYYNKAEVVDFRFAPERPFPSRDLFRASLTVRAGT